MDVMASSAAIAFSGYLSSHEVALKAIMHTSIYIPIFFMFLSIS
jgi:hypothetical protein